LAVNSDAVIGGGTLRFTSARRISLAILDYLALFLREDLELEEAILLFRPTLLLLSGRTIITHFWQGLASATIAKLRINIFRQNNLEDTAVSIAIARIGKCGAATTRSSSRNGCAKRLKSYSPCDSAG
jgi:hypothetical protein